VTTVPDSASTQGAVLVVDDDRINRTLLRRSLEADGHSVTTVEHGRAALESLETALPDVILLDIVMPELDGFEVLDAVKANPRTRDIPVIMISAVDEMDSVVRCIEAGAEDYLPKPFDATLLRARINAGLMKRRLAQVEHDRVRDVFARFLPETVVDEVMRDTNGEPRLGGVRLVGTVLFSDLRGFTTFAEHTAPDVVVDVLNRYFSEMSDAVLDNGGTLLGFLGDGVLAVFGAPIASDDHADRALMVARQMLYERLPQFNAWTRAELGEDAEFRMGIGISSGPFMSGNVGSARRLEYTAIGDPVNTAARLQELTKELRRPVLVADSTRALLQSGDGGLEFVEDREVRGKAERVKLWTLGSEAT
jgi:class 3 adenylate cyclase